MFSSIRFFDWLMVIMLDCIQWQRDEFRTWAGNILLSVRPRLIRPHFCIQFTTSSAVQKATILDIIVVGLITSGFLKCKQLWPSLHIRPASSRHLPDTSQWDSGTDRVNKASSRSASVETYVSPPHYSACYFYFSIGKLDKLFVVLFSINDQ